MIKRNKRNYIVREEAFGYTLFDRVTLRHKFLSKTDFDRLGVELEIGKNDYQFLPIKRKNIRKDIIYSPVRIYYEITLACNLACRFCFNNAGRSREKELTTNEVIKSLYDLRKENVIDIHFTGGEFTLRKDWYQIFSEAKKIGFVVSCNTNGVFLNRDIVNKLVDLNLDQITISIDGSRKNHEKNRGFSTFNKSVDSLKRLHKLGANLRINTLISKFSLNDIGFMLDLAYQYTKEINFFTIVFIGRGAGLESRDSVTLKEHLKMAKIIDKLKPKYPGLNILHFARVTKETSVNAKEHNEFGIKVGPPSGTTTFNIISDGSLYCGGYVPYISASFCLGNIKKDNIFDVWQNNRELESIRNDSRNLMLFCSKCKKFIDNECQGSKYETELNRLINPRSKNLCCIYDQEGSLLKVINKI